MATVPFDTLRAFKELQDAGFDEAQAEVLTNLLVEAHAGQTATKAETRDTAITGEVEDETVSQIIADIIRNKVTKQDLHAFEVRLTVRLGGLILVWAGLIIAAFWLLA